MTKWVGILKYLSILIFLLISETNSFFPMDSFLISVRYIFPKIENLSPAWYVSELCCKNAFLYFCCNKVCNKNQNCDLDFVLFSKSLFSRDEVCSAVGGGFPTPFCVLLLLGHLLLCQHTFSSFEDFSCCQQGSLWQQTQWSDRSLVSSDPSPSAGWQIWHPTGSPFSLTVIWTPRSFLTHIWHASARLNMTELFTLSVQSAISPDNGIRQCNLLKLSSFHLSEGWVKYPGIHQKREDKFFALSHQIYTMVYWCAWLFPSPPHLIFIVVFTII